MKNIIKLLFPLIFSNLSYADFPEEHGCSSSSNSVCDNQTSIKTPDWNNPRDYLVVPHRGDWGVNPSIPENTVLAVEEANDNGYIAVEMDFVRTQGEQFIATHDFVVDRLANTSDSRYIWDIAAEELAQYKLYQRDGEIVTDISFSSLEEISQIIAQYGVVLFVDTRPKKAKMDYKQNPPVCLDLCDYPDGSVAYDEEYIRNINSVIEVAGSLGALNNLVFKVPFPIDYIKSNVPNFYRVLWMPQVNPTKLKWFKENHEGEPGVTITTDDLVEFIDEWQEENSSISSFETAYGSRGDLRLQPFTAHGLSYSNTMHYIKEATGYRSGTFSGEPVGEKGLVDEFGRWRFTPDLRANHSWLVSPEYVNTMVITTDRPDYWEQYKE